MVKHTTFLKWWLQIASTSVGVYFAYKFGVFHEIMEKDESMLSFLIIAGFVLMSLWCGVKTFIISRSLNLNNKIPTESELKVIKQEDYGWFACAKFEQIGYIGTLVGFIIMLAGFSTVDPSQMQSLQALIIALASGMATALYTTLAGLVCSHLLSYQYQNLANAIKSLPYEDQ